MDFITREQARRDIVDLGLPQIVLNIFDEASLPFDLDLTFHVPYPILCLGPEQQAHYIGGRVTPLWAEDGDYRIVAYHHAPNRRGFFRFDIEGGKLRGPIGLTWQQILVDDFKLLWELQMPDDQLKEIAALFQFKHIDLLISELPHANLDTVERDVEWHRSLLNRVRD